MAAILIVDDDPTIRAIATELLRDGDHAVVQAADGREAIRILQAAPIDLMVLDMLMPEMDGLETIMEARQIRPSVRILAMSSGGSMDAGYLLAVARTIGAHAVLEKPLTACGFQAAVDQLLGGDAAESAGLRTSV
ncbi:MAG: response regulator [Brevundimonas sp.]